MFEIYKFSHVEIMAFALVLLRLSAFFVTWPVFGQNAVPSYVKVLLSLVVAFVIFPLVGWRQLPAKELEDQLIWLAGREVMVGVILGFLVRLFFTAIEMAGQLATDALGLGNAQIFNPTIGGQVGVIQEFYVIIASLFFLALNGHHIFITGVVDSFRLFPLSLQGFNLQIFGESAKIARTIVEAGIKIGAPVLVAIFFTNIAMAVVGRAVPQINIFITSLPVNIGVGLLVMGISLPMLFIGMNGLLNETAERFFMLLKNF